MITAGDEFGRTQHGNNNAYAQDNAEFWVNWATRDAELENHVAALARLRRIHPLLQNQNHLAGKANEGLPDVIWLRADGLQMQAQDWDLPDAGTLMMVLADPNNADTKRLAILFNRSRDAVQFTLPLRLGFDWRDSLTHKKCGATILAAPRNVMFAEEY